MPQNITTHHPEASQNLSKCPLDPGALEVPVTPLSAPTPLCSTVLFLQEGRWGSPCHSRLLLRQLERTALARGPRGEVTCLLAGVSSSPSQPSAAAQGSDVTPSPLLGLTSSLWLQLTEPGRQPPGLSPSPDHKAASQVSGTLPQRAPWACPGPSLSGQRSHPSSSLAWDIPIAS